jgi:hypothetical protein
MHHTTSEQSSLTCLNALSQMTAAITYPCLLVVCREALHQTEQRVLQLKQLLQKDVLIKAAFTAYMYGRFTYPQVSGTAYKTCNCLSGHVMQCRGCYTVFTGTAASLRWRLLQQHPFDEICYARCHSSLL